MMTAGAGSILAATLVFGDCLTASATSKAQHGEVDPDKPAALIQPRVTERAGGGVWNHWMTFTKNYSEYYHGSKTHKTTVKNGFGRGTQAVGSQKRNGQKRGVMPRCGEIKLTGIQNKTREILEEIY